MRNYRDREAVRLFERERAHRLPARVQRAAHRKLLLLDAADTLGDLRVPPANRLEELSGERQGKHAIRIDERWRICFRWDRGEAYDVEIADASLLAAEVEE